jgi:hypothetical protein
VNDSENYWRFLGLLAKSCLGRQYSSIIGGRKHDFANILFFYWRKCYLFTPDKPDISDILAPIFTGFNMVKFNPGNAS